MERDILVSWEETVDVPEVSPSEMETVFEARRGLDPDLPDLGDKFRICLHNGKHYRYLGNLSAFTGQRSPLKTAFEPNYLTFTLGPWSAISRHAKGDELRSPLGRPIQNHLSLHLNISDPVGQREIGTWPSTGEFHMPEKRNDFSLANVIAKVRGVDLSDTTSQKQMRDRQSSRLLVAGNDLWAEETPLCFVVSTYGWDTWGQVNIDFAHTPTWLDPDMTKRYFPLSRFEEAMEYAEWSSRVSKRPIKNETGVWNCEDIGQFEFDPRPDEIAKVSFTLSCDTKRALLMDVRRAELLDGGQIAAVDRGHAATLEANYVLDDKPDISDDLPEIVDSWKRLGRKPGLWGVMAHLNRKGFFDDAVERAMTYVHDGYISIPLRNPVGTPVR
jgi:hypothetical protein